MTPWNFEYTLYLDEKQMTCFPKSTEKRISKCQSRLAAIELYSKCCMPYKKSSRRYEYRITECCQCLEWYHVYIYIYIIYIYIYIYIWTRNQCVHVLHNNSKTKNTTFVWRISEFSYIYIYILYIYYIYIYILYIYIYVSLTISNKKVCS